MTAVNEQCNEDDAHWLQLHIRQSKNIRIVITADVRTDEEKEMRETAVSYAVVKSDRNGVQTPENDYSVILRVEGEDTDDGFEI